jgi:hypothetical protein
MPLKSIRLKPGVNRENTRYTTEGGWYECDKIRFRQGYPEKMGGWERISTNTFLGVCRSLWNWSTLAGQNLVGVGTNLKFYIERSGAYNDITPIRKTTTPTNPFDTVDTSTTVTVNDTGHGCTDGSFVIISGASAVGGITPDGEYQITLVDVDSYTIEHGTPATSTVNGGGGTPTIQYQLNVGSAIGVPISGWGGGTWGAGVWGGGGTTTTSIRLWSQSNFGEDLVFCYRGGPPCYWDASGGVSTRGTLLSELASPSDVPVVANVVLVSDINRFVFAFGTNEIDTAVLDPMLIRWTAQEAAQVWTPSATNEAGSLRLSHGTEIVTAIQARQEVLVWTNEALYGLQFIGGGAGWGAQSLGDNISIASQHAAMYANNTAYWMGREQFYIYDGTVNVLPCDVRKYIFNDFNSVQIDQVFAGHNEQYSEIWWFYCSSGSTTVDRYVCYNYRQNIWYYGTMARTAWIDSKLRNYPIAATYNNNLVWHEIGVDDKETATVQPISASITSSEFDIEDGHRFGFIRRILPDVTFDGSVVQDPSITMTLYPMKNAGSDYKVPGSISSTNMITITQGTEVNVEPFTGQAFVRVRGRQMAIKVESTGEGVTWQLGTPRIDMRPSGRRSGG